MKTKENDSLNESQPFELKAISMKLKLLLLSIISLMSLSIFAQDILSTDDINKEIITGITGRVNALYESISSNANQELNVNETCRDLGELKGMLRSGILVSEKLANNGKTYPFDLAFHFLNIEYPLNLILSNCGVQMNDDVVALLKSQLKDFNKKVSYDLELAIQAAAGKSCTDTNFKCQI